MGEGFTNHELKMSTQQPKTASHASLPWSIEVSAASTGRPGSRDMDTLAFSSSLEMAGGPKFSFFSIAGMWKLTSRKGIKIAQFYVLQQKLGPEGSANGIVLIALSDFDRHVWNSPN